MPLMTRIEKPTGKFMRAMDAEGREKSRDVYHGRGACPGLEGI